MTRARVVLRDSTNDDDEATEADGKELRLAPETRERVGVPVGGAVRVEGADDTVATVGPDSDAVGPDSALAGDDVRRNVGDTDAVTIARVDPEPAAEVVVAPAQPSALEGDADALARALAGRHLTAGDRVNVRLFGGTVVVAVDVVETEPGSPVTATAETTVTLQPVEDGGTDAEPVPAADGPRSGLGGLREERATLRRLVAAPLVDDAFDDVGARSPAGVLVHGPAGTGKTLLVHTVADSAGLPVHEVTPADARDRDALAAVLRAASDDAPAVLFVEDLPAAAPNPEAGGGGSPQTESQLGWLLDRVRDRAGLVVVGEAASADAVDPALRRGGRFDGELRVGVPGSDARREILAVHADGVGLDDDVDLDAVAARTHGYTGADLEAVLVDAATRAVGRSAARDPVVAARDVDAALDAVGPSTLREVTVERPSVSYRDIGGLEPAKREVVRTVEWPQRYPDLFERLDADAPTGVLLYGPPGTGKTMLAKAVAESTNANFLAVDGPELMDRYVGESEKGVRELFERARRLAPSVVFLDELDALAPARRDTDTGAAERVVSQLLTELDGLSARGEVAVLAATNRPDSVDPALLRPGRIEKRVEVPVPDRDARAAILDVHLADVATGGGVDTGALADATPGYTGSDLAGVVREAALLAMENHLRQTDFDAEDADGLVLQQDHLQRAVDRTEPSVGESA
jgi:transitional endoplasmic reticulum ATPase